LYHLCSVLPWLVCRWCVHKNPSDSGFVVSIALEARCLLLNLFLLLEVLMRIVVTI